MEPFDFILAGANFRPADTKEFIRNSLDVGHAVTFERDPDNQWDALAIKVMGQEQTEDDEITEYFIGFVPKADNPLMAKAMDDGQTFSGEVVSFVGDIKPVIRVTPDGTA